MYRLLQLLELIHNPPPKNVTKRPDSPKSQVWRILIYHSSKSKTTQEQSESVGLLTSPTCRPGAVNLHNLHIEIIRITILIIIWPFKLLNSLWTQPPPECPHTGAHCLWSLVQCSPGQFSDNDKWLKNICDENNKIITSDTFKTGDLSNYLIFSDMRGRG